ncbi:MAG TPA: LysM peptidoglycan-binding domain-containing protein [Candidatus Enterocloster faecavium]|uniref:LysM peptidoglycan-binding domain-containing protein n=1 Tax=Candidatus Enterocloster faecavium TaxID=2838560 RepID=A0A9D2RLW5_9FIRM|nr:LysM peptidoglycan-binding domain-containing protein [Candidatus Enterocloster faecavium]
MGELYEPYPRLPKNIRQIGERDQVLKLYVEDYVNTYLKRLKPWNGTDLRVGLLLGNVEMRGETPYVFVDGALEMEGVAAEGETVVFTEEAWKKAYQDIEQMFPKRTVQGWFLCGAEGSSLSPLNYWKQHGQYFTGKNQLMYLNSGLEGEEAIYITSPDGFYKLKGYSIFYERNQMMQDYMVLRKDARRVETSGNDRVIQDFKKRMDQRKSEAVHERGTVHLLTGLCGVLTVTVLAGGVAMFNNFQKMRQMESVIASVLPGGTVMEETVPDPSGKGYAAAGEPDYLIEEAEGNISPVQSSGDGAETAGAEKAGVQGESGSYVVPETMPPVKPSAAEETEKTETETSGAVSSSQAAPSGEAKSQKAAAADADYRIYQVAPGETLYGICFQLYGNLDHLEEICSINGLESENSIYAGQKLLMP